MKMADAKGAQGGQTSATDSGAASAGGAGAGAGEDKGASGKFAAAGAAAAGAGKPGDQGAGAAGDGKSSDGSIQATWPADWRVQIAGGDEKLLKRAERYDSPKAIWNALVAAQNRISAGELRPVLPKDAKPEEIAAWRKEMGVPEKADGYDLKLPDGTVAGVDDKATMAGFLDVAHGLNLNSEQARTLLQWNKLDTARRREELMNSDAAFKQKSEDQLRADWGTEFRQNMNMIDALMASAPAEIGAQFMGARLADGRPLAADPVVLKWLNGLAREINPTATIVPAGGGDIASSIDAELAKISEFRKKDRKAYNNDEAMQKRERDLIDAKRKAEGKKAA
jgi:hypothetical protein